MALSCSPSVWTKYIAEPVNTVRKTKRLTQLTNLFFIGAALYGMYRVYEQRLLPRFYGSYTGTHDTLTQAWASSASAPSSST